jgi:hypothetical protein
MSCTRAAFSTRFVFQYCFRFEHAIAIQKRACLVAVRMRWVTNVSVVKCVQPTNHFAFFVSSWRGICPYVASCPFSSLYRPLPQRKKVGRQHLRTMAPASAGYIMFLKSAPASFLDAFHQLTTDFHMHQACNSGICG